ncbi:MAG: hypothetical protein PWQ96_2296 [Clostridia bacterium]|jgi:hypothetical protein|nr:hypothetical protein [Clostridiales bacterium]MDK2986652.1 hypothetical protein [Clostridia bacterium]
MPEICPLSSCRWCSPDGSCLHEDYKGYLNDCLSALKGTSEYVDCYEQRE